MTMPIKVLFVCLGNICRSPSAEGVFRQLVEDAGLSAQIQTDSCGTGNWHVGEPPDSRAVEAASHRGIDITDLRARQFRREDFDRFNYVLAMDDDNYQTLARMADESGREKLAYFLDFAAELDEREVPDPYYHGGFPRVLSMIEQASLGLLAHIQGNDLQGD